MSYIWPKVLFLRSPVTSILLNSLDNSKSSSCLIISTWQSLSSHHSRNVLHLAYRIPHSPAFSSYLTSHFPSIFFCWLLQCSSFHFGNILGFLLFIISSLTTIEPWKVQYSSWHYLATQLFHCCLHACSGHPELEIKVLHYSTLYSEVHKSATACRGCTHVTVHARHMSWPTWLDMRTHVRIFESLQLDGSYVGGLLYLSSVRKDELLNKCCWYNWLCKRSVCTPTFICILKEKISNQLKI